MSYPQIIHVKEKTVSDAFCNKNFKSIRVYANATSRLCLSLFYNIISCYYRWIGSHAFQNYYQSIAYYHYNRGWNQLYAYLTFENEIINFSINSLQIRKDFFTNDDVISKAKTLRNLYGSVNLERWLKIQEKHFFLDENELHSKAVVKRGCCVGMSLDFISQYLKSERPPLETVQSITSSHKKGASNEAHLAQIFFESLRLQKNIETQLRADGHSFLQTLPDDQYQKLAKECLGMENLMTRYKEICPKFLQTNQKIYAGKYQPIAKNFGIVIDVDSLSIYRCREDHGGKFINDSAFSAFVNNLLNGVYLVRFLSKSGTGHIIVYIRTKTEHFIYDPNLATLVVDLGVSASRLAEIAGLYLKRDDPITFLQAHQTLLLNRNIDKLSKKKLKTF